MSEPKMEPKTITVEQQSDIIYSQILGQLNNTIAKQQIHLAIMQSNIVGLSKQIEELKEKIKALKGDCEDAESGD